MKPIDIIILIPIISLLALILYRLVKTKGNSCGNECSTCSLDCGKNFKAYLKEREKAQ